MTWGEIGQLMSGAGVLITELLQSFEHGRKRVPEPSKNGLWTVHGKTLGQAGGRTTECHGGHRSTCRLVRFAASHAVPSRAVP